MSSWWSRSVHPSQSQPALSESVGVGGPFNQICCDRTNLSNLDEGGKILRLGWMDKRGCSNLLYWNRKVNCDNFESSHQLLKRSGPCLVLWGDCVAKMWIMKGLMLPVGKAIQEKRGYFDITMALVFEC